jgi:hypothetical protein
VLGEKMGIVRSFRGEGRVKRALPCVWICRVEVGRKGGVGGRRERVVETVLEVGRMVEGVRVVVVVIDGE